MSLLPVLIKGAQYFSILIPLLIFSTDVSSVEIKIHLLPIFLKQAEVKKQVCTEYSSFLCTTVPSPASCSPPQRGCSTVLILVSHPLQREFIQFCKTLYSMFHEDPEENDLYQAIATVTTLLLQIGEVGQRSISLESGSDEFTEDLQPEAAASDQDAVFTDTVKTPHKDSQSSPVTEGDWTVSFEHILASLLTEQSLVNFFEKPLELKPKLENAKLNQYSLKTNGTSCQSRGEQTKLSTQ